jgi:hypothetical protein
MFESVDFVELSGISGASDVSFHIEGFRLKKNSTNLQIEIYS